MNIKNLKSISFPEARKFLMDYVRSKPEYESKWKDYFEGGAGTNLIDVAAGTISFLGFNSYMARKDSLLDYSALPSTVMTLASTLGYKYNRRSTPRFKITFNCPRNISWNKFEPIGEFRGRPISTIENTMIKAGKNTLELVVGEWKEKRLVLTETKDFFSVAINEEVDNNYYHVVINDEPIQVKLNQEDLDSNSIYIRSHKDGIYLIFGNGSQGRKPQLAEELRIEYVKPENKYPTTSFKASEIQLNIDADIELVKMIDQGSNPDSMEKLVAVAPGYYSTQRLLVSYSDYEFIGASFKGLVSTKARPHSKKCCSVDIFYLREDEQRFTPTQLLEFEDYLEEHAMLGTAFFVYPSSPIDLDVQIKLYLKEPEYKDQVEELIRNHIEFQCMKLGVKFSLSSLFDLEFPTPVRLYIDFPIKDKIAKENQYFRLSDLSFKYITNISTEEISQGVDLERGYYEHEYDNSFEFN